MFYPLNKTHSIRSQLPSAANENILIEFGVRTPHSSSGAFRLRGSEAARRSSANFDDDISSTVKNIIDLISSNDFIPDVNVIISTTLHLYSAKADKSLKQKFFSSLGTYVRLPRKPT